MPGRSYSATNGYRYGFNGKENDNEVKGEGNQQDYGMRIYDPRLGRFLSVDPLTKGFPWYTPYQFAGNKPTIAIDLDGAEEEFVTIYSHPANGKPGKAKLEIVLDYKVVTAGPGSLSRPDLVNPNEFCEKFAQGSTTLNLSVLPTPELEMKEATNKMIKEGKYYETEITFRYNVDNSPNQDLCRVADWVDENQAGRGLIALPISEGKNDGGFDTYNVTKYLSNSIADTKKFANENQVGGAGATERLVGRPNNVILMNPQYYDLKGGDKFSYPLGASSTELVVHEAGHNSMENAIHTENMSGNYEYNQTGLQSNQKGRIYVTPANRKDIINDSKNRSTIKTTDLTKPAQK